MNHLQMETIDRLHKQFGIACVTEWDFQPGIVFIEYVTGGRAEILSNGRAFRRFQSPDESLGRVHDLTREALRTAW